MSDDNQDETRLAQGRRPDERPGTPSALSVKLRGNRGRVSSDQHPFNRMVRRFMDSALSTRLESRLFFGGLAFEVHVSHDWGALFCADCGSWPKDSEALRTCKGDPRAFTIGARLYAAGWPL